MMQFRRFTRYVFVLLMFGACTVVAVPSHAFAATQSPPVPGMRAITQELHITAKVLPAQRIVVDYSGQILEITSNTALDTTPTVYLLNDSPDNQIALTDSIRERYLSLIWPGTAKPGTLYKRGPLASFIPRPLLYSSTVVPK